MLKEAWEKLEGDEYDQNTIHINIYSCVYAQLICIQIYEILQIDKCI